MNLKREVDDDVTHNICSTVGVEIEEKHCCQKRAEKVAQEGKQRRIG